MNPIQHPDFDDSDPFAGEPVVPLWTLSERPPAGPPRKDTLPRFYSNTVYKMDGEPGYYGVGMVDCSSRGRSRYIWRSYTPDATIDITDDATCYRNEDGEARYAFECPNVEEATALTALLNRFQTVVHIERPIIGEFYDAVNRRAEATMLATNRVEGAHCAALNLEYRKVMMG